MVVALQVEPRLLYRRPSWNGFGLDIAGLASQFEVGLDRGSGNVKRLDNLCPWPSLINRTENSLP